MKVDLATTERLMPRIPAETFAVSESGILNEQDMRRVRRRERRRSYRRSADARAGPGRVSPSGTGVKIEAG